MIKNEPELKLEGVVVEALPNATFKVRLDDGNEILSYLSGRMRINHIKILPGDRVVVEMTLYDNKRGRIVFRK